ncbi:spermatogenesis-associated protein 20 [Anthonomus grandis grandis]|uniref:spermatogenesis-associated protein 20 n=1 Tax=Anthonomus grandis grandis TaxID=2921223 RepID=UPI002166189F|nr:spermatogenesis-associated protein 20 [Anthonomus grandis grandis]
MVPSRVHHQVALWHSVFTRIGFVKTERKLLQYPEVTSLFPQKNNPIYTQELRNLPPAIILKNNQILSKQMASSSRTVSGQLNRLALERSPYLLQHATNPVDWYPWGEEAFKRAQEENKPIFLSVGYSTCHWCHVMEKESFENEEVAKIMNEHFINIKVDREERPDVDRMYMAFIQATSGGGGWPMSVFLTPTLEPLAGGTYFPVESKGFGVPSFPQLLLNISKEWNKNSKALMTSGKFSLKALQEVKDNKTESASLNENHLGEECWQKCALQLSRSYEADFGGFSMAPKFPQPSNLNFLFHMYAKEKDTERGFQCLEMCLHTLKKMAYGGIHDHVNKGFARYSVDERWHVPHFEKMLYDQAQLAVSYCDAYILTKDEFYADVAKNIFTFVSRDLSHELGGFYGAQDADSYPYEGAPHKMEGAFCVWEYDEIKKLITEKTNGIKHFDILAYHYSIRENGNVSPAQDPHKELKNKNVLSCFGSYELTARHFNISVDELKNILEKSHEILYQERQQRPKPDTDTKIVTSWNGLMLSAFARAGFALKNQSYINRAILAANFVKKFLYNESEKTLLRCCYRGDDGQIVQTSIPIRGFLDDYAFMIRGLLDLYEASLDADWLQWAEVLQEKQDTLFWDDKSSGYFNSSAEDKSILIRSKEDQDGAEPCGNSVSVHNLVRLSSYLHRKDLREKAGKTLQHFSERLRAIPIALPEMTSALMLYKNCPTQVFIAGASEDNSTQALLDVVRSHYIPGRVLAIADGPAGRAGLLYRRIETLHRLKPVEGRAAAYVCRNFACSLPVTDPGELATSLDAQGLSNRGNVEKKEDQ